MFIEKMLNDGSSPLLEQVVRFSAARHQVIAENIANIDTPGYVQKDLSVERFNRDLRQFIAARKRGGGAARSVQDIDLAIDHPPAGILFHDRNNRSMEHLQSDLAKNALMHNMAIELLRKQYQTIEMAIKERVT